MSQSLKHRKRIRARKRRRKRRIRRIICLFSFLILLTGFFFIWKAFHPDESADPQPTIPLKNLVIKQTVSEEETDLRTVKNTATKENHKTNGLAICMYHYVYDKDDPPDNLNANYIEVDALEEELKYLVENDYFFPTWEEVRQYIDGELLLPEKSIVLTFDDGAKNFLELGAPLFDKYKIPVTSFLITSKNGEDKVAKYENDYVTFQSHSHNMHRAGGNIGHGGIFPVIPQEEAIADLKQSIEICHHGDAFAYPYGDYTDSCVQAVSDAEFLCAVTTEYGRAYPGDNPLLLPRMRMSHGQSLEQFISMVE